MRRKIKVYTHIDDYGQMVDNIRVKVDNKINMCSMPASYA